MKSLPLLPPLAALAAGLSAASALQALEFDYGFECPAEVRGAPGSVVRFEVLATITSSGQDSPSGVSGWALSIEAVGG